MGHGEVGHLAALRAHPVGDPEQDAEDDQRARDQPQRAEGRLDLILEEQSEHHDRDAADDDQPAELRVRVIARDPAEERPEPVRDDAHDVAPEEQHDGRLGAELRDRGEGRTRVLSAREELSEDAQMRAGRDGEELGEALDEARG